MLCLLLYSSLLWIASGTQHQLAARDAQARAIGAEAAGTAPTSWLRGWALSQFTLRPLRLFYPAASPTEAVAWSPDGRWLATGSSDGTVAEWQARDGRLRWAVRPRSGRVSSLSWSTDGDQLAVGVTGAALLSLDARTAQVQFLAAAAPHVSPSAAFSPDGRWLALATGRGDVQIWSASGTRSPRYARTLAIGGATTALDWSSDSRLLGIGGMTGAFWLWSAESGRLTRSLPAGRHGPLWSLQWSPVSARLAVGWADGNVEILAGSSLVQAGLLHAGGAVNTLGWSADGSLLAVTAVGKPLEVWDAQSRTLIARLVTGWDNNQAAWSPDGRFVAAGTDAHDLRLWQVEPPAAGLASQLCKLQPVDCALPAGHPGGVTSYMGR